MRAGTGNNNGFTKRAAATVAWLLIAPTALVVAPQVASAAPCDEPIVNEIACENTKPGNPPSQWDVNGAGSSSIQGFATDISVDQGETVRFKVDTTASSFRLDIYRMGYYGGDGARLVDTTNPTSVTNQPNCLSDASTGLLDCGNWSESASWNVPADAVSGIYFAKLVRTDGSSGSSHVMFIVRDDDGGSDLLFQTADTTWQAYNAYGGNSLYTGSPAGRAYKLSYNRPFTTRDNAPEDWVFNAEYPMVRYLESNGYDVSYTTGIDSDRLGAELLEHQVFVSVGHDEYWSGPQRTNVEAARDAGVNLAFFSGNEVYWKTRWESSIDGSGTPYRTLVSYKETADGAITDPAHPTWTGTWRDQRFSPPADGGRPENELTGTIFRVNCCEIDMEVTAADGDMRFWRNTRAADLTGSQTTTVGSGVVGYEWDQDEDNGFRPAGLFRVSETYSDNLEILLDEGASFGPGSATHAMTMYRAPSGALVFGAGTVQWSWGLDSEHDRGSSATSDVAAQQATVNLFADMGVQPSTLQPGLVAATASTDTVAPTSVITDPIDGGTLPSNATVVVSGTATDSGGGQVGGVEVSLDGGSTWHRANGRASWNYEFNTPSTGTLQIMSRATDDSANLETPSAGNTVAIGGNVTCPCSIWSAAAQPDRTELSDTNSVEIGTVFEVAEAGYITGIRFHKAVENTGTHVGSLWTASGTNLGSVTFTNESASGWQQADFGNPIPVVAGETYVASYFAPNGQYSASSNYFTSGPISNGPLTALSDAAAGGNGRYQYSGAAGTFPANSFQSENYWVDVVFDTSANDTTPPSIVSRSPGVGASGVAVGSSVSAGFNEPVSGAVIGLAEVGGGAVSSSSSYDAGTRTITLVPDAALDHDTQYEVTVSGATDTSGNTMSATNWTFTTGSLPPPLPTEGPGGPIGVVTSGADPFSGYFAEILRAEGLNEFETFDVGDLDAAKAAEFTVIVLGPVSLSGSQVSMLTSWVDGGGNLIASRPDPQLAGLLGLSPAGGTLSDAYIDVDTSAEPGAGIVTDTMQFHGIADLYTTSGASTVATLYSDVSTPTSNPAVTLRSVGANGGQVAAFTYDLARSVIYTRQGNPAWEGQERDEGLGDGIIRTSDLYFGGTEPDWVDLNKVAIPQADEQQRLLANLIQFVNKDAFPLPKFWYFPDDHRAVVVATGDDHATGGTAARFDSYLAASPGGCSLADWECPRITSYIYPELAMTDAAAAAYEAQGFELAPHVENGCRNFTSTNDLRSTYTGELADFAQQFPSVSDPVTNRFHCLVWSDWSSQAEVEGENGIRFDTNYYYWPSSWVNDRPGFMTGSGMPQRFTTTNGDMIDVYQGATQMTDESGQSYPFTINTLLDRALGAEGYYGYFVTNHHTDFHPIVEDSTTLSAAQSRGVPVVTARQALEFIDGRNASSFGNLAWSSDTLTFDISVGTGANNLTAMLPMSGPNGTVLETIVRGATPVSFQTTTIKGISYATFGASGGAHTATYNPPAPDVTPPTVTGVVPLDGATDVSTSALVSVSFSELVVGSSVSIVVTPAGGSAVAGSTSYDAGSSTATFTPSSALASETVFTVDVSGATDPSGNTMGPVSSSFTTAVSTPSGCPCTILESAVPPVESSPDSAVELGVKFQSALDGDITAIRFYKGAGNTGTHVGNLWTSTGTLLGSVTFTNETATGWQEATFASPVAVTAGTTYVASYHAPNGGYAIGGGEFASPVTNGPLTALSSGASGGNGVYGYGSGGFPTSSFNSSNYYVDVVFSDGPPPPDVTPPSVTTVVPADGSADVPVGAAVSVTFSEPVVDTSVQITVTPAGGSAVAGSTSYDAGTTTATFTPTSPLANATTYAVDVSGATDPSGNTMGPVTTTFTTVGAGDVTPPSVTAVVPADGATDVAIGSAVAVTFSEPVVDTSVQIVVTPAGGSAVAGSVSYDAGSNTSTFTPSSALADDTTFTVDVSGASDPSGNTMGPVSSSFTTAVSTPSGCPCTILDSAVPPVESSPDSAVELGVKFQSALDGDITAIRFYKGAGNTGTHVGNLWTSTGSLLGSVTFTNESASGWQEATFASPVAVTAGTTYVASYHAPNGGYAIGGGEFAADVTNGPLTALASGPSGGNGVYAYGSGGFPSASYNSSNYYVDVVFSDGPDVTAPTVTSRSPGVDETDVAVGRAVSVTFSEPVVDTTVQIAVTPAGGSAIAGSTSYDAGTRTSTFTPSSALANDTTYTVDVSGATDAAANTMTPVSWSFTSASPSSSNCPCSLFAGATIPPIESSSDTGAVELGMKFQSDEDGLITGVRFYKGSANTGTHFGNLWTESGTNLGTVTFTNETATGWQEATFATPIAITAGTTYVVSYHAPNGGYALEGGGFSSEIVNGSLTGLATGASGGNGVYAYGSGGFPNSTYNASNYFVDVVFETP